MEELPALTPSVGEIVMTLVNVAIFLAVAIASYRRSRCLSGYPVWQSLAIAIVAGAFWLVWLLASVINRDRLAREWDQYRRESDGHKVSSPGTVQAAARE